MKIVSLFKINPEKMHQPSPEMIQHMDALIEECRAKGVMIDTGGAMPGSLEMRVRRSNGSYTVTDGPFAEAKEVIGGFAVMNVESREDAIAWTKRFLDIAGDGECEIHEVGVY